MLAFASYQFKRSQIHLCSDVNFPSGEVNMDPEKELNYDIVKTKKVVKSHFVIDYNIAYSACTNNEKH